MARPSEYGCRVLDILLAGPPGSGKSILAQRFAGLLPPMTAQEAVESAAIASSIADLAGCANVQVAHVAESVQYRRGLAQAASS